MKAGSPCIHPVTDLVANSWHRAVGDPLYRCTLYLPLQAAALGRLASCNAYTLVPVYDKSHGTDVHPNNFKEKVEKRQGKRKWKGKGKLKVKSLQSEKVETC